MTRLVLFASASAAVALGCGTPAPSNPPQLPALVTMADAQPAPALVIRELYARDADRIVLAPDEDQAVAQTYATASHGAVHDGYRMTIMTARTSYAVGETVRVVHIVEAAAGRESFVMGPKAIYGEYVDGALRTPEPELPDYPWVGVYDGAVLQGPDADVNFEVTTYVFDEPGPHTIEWRLGALRSNVIELAIER